MMKVIRLIYWLKRKYGNIGIRAFIVGVIASLLLSVLSQNAHATDGKELFGNILKGVLKKTFNGNSFNGNSFKKLANTCLRSSDHYRGVSACTKALKFKLSANDNANLFSARGTHFLNLNNLQPARRDYDNALKYNPRHSFALNNRGIINEREGKLQRALRDFRAASKVNRQFKKNYRLIQSKIAKAKIIHEPEPNIPAPTKVKKAKPKPIKTKKVESASTDAGKAKSVPTEIPSIQKPVAIITTQVNMDELAATPKTLANEPSYRTTVDFIIKHGTGWQNGEKVIISEPASCVVKISSTSFKVIETKGTSSELDLARPVRTDSRTIPVKGLMAELLLNANRMRDRLEFKMRDGVKIIEHTLFHEKPTGVTFLNNDIHTRLNGRKITAGFEGNGTLTNTYWMMPGKRNQVRRKFKPLHKAFKHLIKLCGGVQEADFGVFGDNEDESTNSGFGND